MRKQERQDSGHEKNGLQGKGNKPDSPLVEAQSCSSMHDVLSNDGVETQEIIDCKINAAQRIVLKTGSNGMNRISKRMVPELVMI
jgi:hypothetical protein